eukprot:4885791-Pyramimonas_sp.AAC.1
MAMQTMRVPQPMRPNEKPCTFARRYAYVFPREWTTVPSDTGAGVVRRHGSVVICQVGAGPDVAFGVSPGTFRSALRLALRPTRRRTFVCLLR